MACGAWTVNALPSMHVSVFSIKGWEIFDLRKYLHVGEYIFSEINKELHKFLNSEYVCKHYQIENVWSPEALFCLQMQILLILCGYTGSPFSGNFRALLIREVINLCIYSLVCECALMLWAMIMALFSCQRQLFCY